MSKTVRDSLIVSIKFEYEVVCALSNGYVADDLGWPLSTLNHLNFYILHCLMHLRNWRSQRLQIWCTGWMCKSQHGQETVVRSCDPLQNFGAPILSLERLNQSRQILYTSRQYQFYTTGWHITNKRAWLWSRDCFKIWPLVVMQLDAWVCQRQLSYLFIVLQLRSDSC